MEKEKLKNVLECLLFVTDHPLTLLELSEIINETQENLKMLIDEMRDEMKSRNSALQIAEIAEGYQFASREGFSYWIKKLFKDQTTFKLSQSALETLSIVAYKQPITRAEIEEIRGVEVTGVLETLMERKLLKIAGRKETVGRPLLYATTQEFLRQFSLWKVSDLPALDDLTKEVERKKMEESELSGAAEKAAEAATPEADPQETPPGGEQN